MFRSGVSSGHHSTTESSSAAFEPACGRWHHSAVRPGESWNSVMRRNFRPTASGSSSLEGQGSGRPTPMAVTFVKCPVCRSTPWGVDRIPDLSPDGQTIAFFHPTETAPIWGDIWIIPVGGGQPRQLTFDACEVGWPSWSPDGQFIVFSSSRGGSLTLWRVNVAGGTPTALTTGAGEDTEPDVSADGKKLIYSTQRKSWSLVLMDPATGQEKEILSRRTRIAPLNFSPREDRIAFSQPVAAGAAQLFVGSLDGREVRQVTQGEREQNILPHWSGDGASLYFYRLHPTQSFRKISVEGGTSSEVAPLDFRTARDAHVDPRSRAIAYTTIEGGQFKAAIVRDLASGKEHTLGRVDSPSSLVTGFQDGLR